MVRRGQRTDEQVFVHPKSPYARVDALRSGRSVRVMLDGALLADAPSSVMVLETGLPTRYYLDRVHIDWTRMQPTDTVTSCPYKGKTSGYWSVKTDTDTPRPRLGVRLSDAAGSSKITGKLHRGPLAPARRGSRAQTPRPARQRRLRHPLVLAREAAVRPQPPGALPRPTRTHGLIDGTLIRSAPIVDRVRLQGPPHRAPVLAPGPSGLYAVCRTSRNCGGRLRARALCASDLFHIVSWPVLCGTAFLWAGLPLQAVDTADDLL